MQPPTIITTPTRFPLGEGKAWEEFATLCLPQGMKLEDCKIVAADKFSYTSLERDSKVIILGHAALAIIYPGLNLDKIRGTLLPLGKTSAIASYHPQDAYDISLTAEDDDDGIEDSRSGAMSEKDTVLTRRSNYFFWIRADVRKYYEKPRDTGLPFKYAPYPDYSALVNWMRKYTSGGHVIYLDIEVNPADHNLLCIGMAIDDSKVAVVPFYTWQDVPHYEDYSVFLGTLSILLSKNRVVCHNSLFDLFILSRFYRVLVGHDIFDTMYVHHRIFPEAEKSLGHAISYWTWLKYHKDTAGGFNPRTREQQNKLYEYCAHDVHSMREVYKSQLAYIAKYEDIAASCSLANSSCYPYLLQQLIGSPIDEEKLLKLRTLKHRQVKQYRRICRLLSGVSAFNPASSKQCIEYFHTKLVYDVVGRTETGQPKMDEKCLQKLRLKYPNPLLEAIIAYRTEAKAESMMNFVNYERPNFK